MVWSLFILLGTFYLLLHGMENSEGILSILRMSLSPQLLFAWVVLGMWHQCTAPDIKAGIDIGRVPWVWLHSVGKNCSSSSAQCMAHAPENSEFVIWNKQPNPLNLPISLPYGVLPLEHQRQDEKVLERSLWDMLPELKSQRNAVVSF